MKTLGVVVLLLIVFFGFINLSGCAHTISAIDHAKMQTWVKMSDTIFLDPTSISKNKSVYIRVTNTSDMQEIAFEHLLRDKLTQKGLTLVDDASKAGFIIQANVLYMDHERETLTGEGMLAGGFGGTLGGAVLGKGDLGTAVVAGAVGAAGGALIGSAFKVETFVGVTDIQIREKVEGGVSGKMKTEAKHGSATTLVTEREVKSEYQEYRTRVVARAKQTNIDKKEAAGVISEKLAIQIAGMF